ncbi:hypothetical protein WN51_07469 [Melipona quadrifasciata]|uniref:Uncharacterized protein n=1 Tax=Melipona quadrifasciata TaxID=166423 RepID=A0A0N0U749_9HYME|nr:hypothetical protein WN51_07469 [Melipona quadrifasciata]
MSSYFANSYIPDLRNGGVEHPHQHQQHYGAAVQVPQQTQSVQQQSQQAGDPCDPSLLRQGVPGHHYGAAGSQQDIPYPRFPPYNRMDMRNATYYQHQQEHGSMDGMGGYRSTSPSPGMGHMGHTPTPNGHPSTPIVYASCKLQAAAVDHQDAGALPGICPVKPPRFPGTLRGTFALHRGRANIGGTHCCSHTCSGNYSDEINSNDGAATRFSEEPTFLGTTSKLERAYNAPLCEAALKSEYASKVDWQKHIHIVSQFATAYAHSRMLNQSIGNVLITETGMSVAAGGGGGRGKQKQMSG